MDSPFQSERDRIDRVREGIEQTGAFLDVRETRTRLQRVPLEKLRMTNEIDRARTQGDEQKIAGLLAQVEALTAERDELQEKVARLERENGIDPLTGVASRRHFEHMLTVEWRRMQRSHGTLGAVFVDLDDFKRINDEHDHRLGDLVLQGVGEQLERAVRRAGELAGRYGGDEFAVLVPNATLEETAGLASRISDALQKMEIRVGDRVLRITASIGVAAAAPYEDRMQPADLLQRADHAAITAKRTGKNRVVAAVLQGDSGEVAFAAVRALGLEEPQSPARTQPQRVAAVRR